MFTLEQATKLRYSSLLSLTFSVPMCTFGRVASKSELTQCALLVEVKVCQHFVSLPAHFGNAENTFQHLWTVICLKILCRPSLGPY